MSGGTTYVNNQVYTAPIPLHNHGYGTYVVQVISVITTGSDGPHYRLCQAWVTMTGFLDGLRVSARFNLRKDLPQIRVSLDAVDIGVDDSDDFATGREVNTHVCLSARLVLQPAY